MDEKVEQQENYDGSNASTESAGVMNDEQPLQAPATELVPEKGTEEEVEQVSKNASAGHVGHRASLTTSAMTDERDVNSLEPGGGAVDETPAGDISDLINDEEDAKNKAVIGEPFSPEGSITPEDGYDHDNDESRPSNLDPGTTKWESYSPKQVEEKGPATDEEAGPGVVNQEQMNFLRELQAENEKLSQASGRLQARLTKYLRRKTRDDTRPEKKAVSDVEQRYQKYLAIMEELKWEHRRISETAQQKVETLRQQSQQTLDLVDRERDAFAALKRDVALAALSRRLGKQAATAEVEQIQAAERRCETELVATRLANIKLKNTTRRLEAALRSQEELADGLHLIDFEQLKIENQTFNEKIEERNEELIKLRKKITDTVHVLTHVKEKLQFVLTENRAERVRLAQVEEAVARKRDELTRTKQARDGLRVDNLKLRRSCGLLGNKTLLRDFEEEVDASDALEERLEELKRRQAEVTLECARIRKKLEHAKPMDE